VKKILIVIAIIFTLLAPSVSHAAFWNWSWGWIFGVSTTSSGPTGSGIQLETGDFLLTEDSKYLIQE
jgi:hypothetical protein